MAEITNEERGITQSMRGLLNAYGSALQTLSSSVVRTAQYIADLDAIVLRFTPQAREDAVSIYSRNVIKEILYRAKLSSATITSTGRTPEEQARVMYNNLEKYGVEKQKKLYGKSGDQVIDVYAKGSKNSEATDEIIKKMIDKIYELGPEKVSHHTVDSQKLNVVDINPKSITDKVAFVKAVEADSRVSKFIKPPKDPAYHIEIPQL